VGVAGWPTHEGWRESSLGIGRVPTGSGDIRRNVAARRIGGPAQQEREREREQRPAKISRDPPRPV